MQGNHPARYTLFVPGFSPCEASEMHFSRKRMAFVAAVLGVVALLGVAVGLYARYVEPEWLKTVRIDMADSTPALRIVHITDTHFVGDRDYFLRAIRRVNALEPDYVCFTGDLVESDKELAEALDLLKRVQAPVLAVMGNHDYWGGCDVGEIREALSTQGGRLLVNESAEFERHGRRVVFVGVDDLLTGDPDPAAAWPSSEDLADATVVALTHSPAEFDLIHQYEFDLGLAGHSHGGQVRVPGYGALVVPPRVGRYEKGLYETPSGPVYVNPGLGTRRFKVRLFCRPEITLFRL